MMARGPWEGRRRPSLLCAASLGALSLLPAAAPSAAAASPLCAAAPPLFSAPQRDMSAPFVSPRTAMLACVPPRLAQPHRSSVSLTRSRSFGCRSLTLGRSLTSVRSTASVSRNDTCLLQHPFAALPLLCWASPGIGDLYLCPLLREERVAR